jgi:nucleoredoxin
MVELVEHIKDVTFVNESHHNLMSLFCNEEQYFVIKNNGEKVPVTELVEKTVRLYFSALWCGPCKKFTAQLVEIYNKLMRKGEVSEIVFVHLDHVEENFKKYHASMPWLALLFGDRNYCELSRHSHVQSISTLIIIGPDGKMLQTKEVDLIREH